MCVSYLDFNPGVGKGRGIAQIPPPRILGQVLAPPKFSTDFMSLPPSIFDDIS